MRPYTFVVPAGGRVELRAHESQCNYLEVVSISPVTASLPVLNAPNANTKVEINKLDSFNKATPAGGPGAFDVVAVENPGLVTVTVILNIGKGDKRSNRTQTQIVVVPPVVITDLCEDAGVTPGGADFVNIKELWDRTPYSSLAKIIFINQCAGAQALGFYEGGVGLMYRVADVPAYTSFQIEGPFPLGVFAAGGSAGPFSFFALGNLK